MPEPPRRHLRREDRIPVDVRLRSQAEYTRLYTRDISRGGMFIETDEPLDVFSAVVLLVHLPVGGLLGLEAEVIHAMPADLLPPGETAGMGLRFTNVSEASQHQLDGWLGLAGPPPADEIPGQTSVPSVTESELPAVAPEAVHGTLSAKLTSLAGDPFEVLDVPRSIAAVDLRRRYLAQAKKYHPQRWEHYADEEITGLARRIVEILHGAYEQARATLERAPSQVPAPIQPPVNPAFRQTDEDLASAAASFQQVRPSPSEAPVELQLSQALKLLAIKQFDAAKVGLRRVLEREPEHRAARMWLFLADARQRKHEGDVLGAIAVYREILEKLDPAHGEALKAVRAVGRKNRGR